MNTKSQFSLLVIVIIVGRCKKKAKKKELFIQTFATGKKICIVYRKCQKRKSEEIRHSQNRIFSAVFSSKYRKTESFFILIFSCSENDFFSNFERTVCFGNRYDKGILNIRPLLCKSIDILLRSVLS